VPPDEDPAEPLDRPFATDGSSLEADEPGEREDASKEEPVDRGAVGRVERLSGDADRPCVRQDRDARIATHRETTEATPITANTSCARVETLMSTRARRHMIARSTASHANQLRCTLALVERTAAKKSLATMSTKAIPTAYAIAHQAFERDLVQGCAAVDLVRGCVDVRPAVVHEGVARHRVPVTRDRRHVGEVRRSDAFHERHRVVVVVRAVDHPHDAALCHAPP
jgi:hypothetical protein